MSRSKCAYSPNSKLRLYTDRTLPPCFQTFLYGLYEKGAWSQVNRVPTSKYELLRMFLKADPSYTVVDQIFFLASVGAFRWIVTFRWSGFWSTWRQLKGNMHFFPSIFHKIYIFTIEKKNIFRLFSKNKGFHVLYLCEKKRKQTSI